MIDKSALIETLTKGMADTDLFLVDVTIGKDNRIVVEIDSDTAVDIEECIRLTRLVENDFDRDVEDYELEIGSAGLTSPLKVVRQYVKNIGNEVEVLTADGKAEGYAGKCRRSRLCADRQQEGKAGRCQASGSGGRRTSVQI